MVRFEDRRAYPVPSVNFVLKAVQDVCAGNHDGIGDLRGSELLAACCILGVSIMHCLRLILLMSLLTPTGSCR